MKLHSRTRSSDSTSISAAITGKTSAPAVKRRSFLSDRRPSPLAALRGYSYTSSAMAPPPSGPDPVDAIKHKAPFIGVVSTFGDIPRDAFLSSLFNPSLRPPLPEQNRPYTSVSVNNHSWRCWVDQVVHPLAQPDHFSGQLAQLDVLVIIYSAQSAASFSSVARICERYLAHDDKKASTEPGPVRTGANLPFPVIVASGDSAVRPIAGDRHVPSSEGEALARKYNGRFVQVSSFNTARNVQLPIEAAVAAWVKGHTGVDILPVDRLGSPSSVSQTSPTDSTGATPTDRVRPSIDKRRKSSIVDDGRSKGSRTSLRSADKESPNPPSIATSSGINVDGSLMSPGDSVFSTADGSSEKKSGRVGRAFRALKRRVNSNKQGE